MWLRGSMSSRVSSAKQKRCSRCMGLKPFSDFYKGTDSYGLYTYCKSCTKNYHDIDTKKSVIDYYGGKCSCCGETEFSFLCIDHVDNDGAQHRKTYPRGGSSGYRRIIRNNFPVGFQVLCCNCNWGKRVNGGVCPHKRHQQAPAT